MNDQPRRGRGPGGGRFLPAANPESTIDLTEDRSEAKKELRIDRTLEELRALFNDAATLASRGREYFDAEWGARRIAKNIVSEIGETVSRLPETYKQRHSEIDWRKINGMRNRVTHDYENVDVEIVWNSITSSIPEMRAALGI
jgi:uncharacterized protein with HEPN domain